MMFSNDWYLFENRNFTLKIELNISLKIIEKNKFIQWRFLIEEIVYVNMIGSIVFK